MSDKQIYQIIVKTGTRTHPFPLLHKKDTLWTARNQISTYELIGKIAREIDKDSNSYISKIDNIVRNNKSQYGVYANNNSWSPVLNERQLLNFTLVFNQ